MAPFPDAITTWEVVRRETSEFVAAATAAAAASSSARIAAYMRVSSMTLAAYDWLITIKPEFRLYQRHKTLSKAVILFFLVRYVSIAATVTSNIGFFGSGFSKRSCENFHFVAPLLKMFATLISQIIISIRTYAISRKSRWVLWALTTLFILSCVPEVLGNAWHRKSVQNASHNCTSGNLPHHKIAWLHYLAAVVFDTAAMGIATFYLCNPTRTITGLAKVMLQEGLLYFIFLTVANMVNLAMFLNPDITAQSSAAVFGQAVTMIMSQRIILNLQEWSSEPNHQSRSRSAPEYPMQVLGQVGPRPQTAPGPKSQDAWLQPGHGKPAGPGWDLPKRGHHPRRGSSTIFDVRSDNGPGLQVVVERDVRCDHDTVSESEKSISDVKK